MFVENSKSFQKSGANVFIEKIMINFLWSRYIKILFDKNIKIKLDYIFTAI